jgi:hypothetical protein
MHRINANEMLFLATKVLYKVPNFAAAMTKSVVSYFVSDISYIQKKENCLYGKIAFY